MTQRQHVFDINRGICLNVNLLIPIQISFKAEATVHVILALVITYLLDLSDIMCEPSCTIKTISKQQVSNKLKNHVQKMLTTNQILLCLHTFVFLMSTSAYQADELHIVNESNQQQGDPLYFHYIPAVTQPLSGVYQRPLLQVPLLNVIGYRGLFYFDMSGVIFTFDNWRWY